MKYEYWLGDDGDYVFQIEWIHDPRDWSQDDYVIHQAWLVPGTEIEDWT